MAKDKKNKKDSPGMKAGRKREPEKDNITDSDFELYDKDSSIDVSDNEASDSELDINELFRKYMPEYSDDGKGAGVLSRLKSTASEETSNEDGSDEENEEAIFVSGDEGEAESESDESLMMALDSAFSKPDPAFDELSDEVGENASDIPTEGSQELPEKAQADSDEDEFDTIPDEEYFAEDNKPAGHRKGIFSFLQKQKDDEFISEYELDSELTDENEADFDNAAADGGSNADDEATDAGYSYDDIAEPEQDEIEQSIPEQQYVPEEKPRGLFSFFRKKSEAYEPAETPSDDTDPDLELTAPDAELFDNTEAEDNIETQPLSEEQSDIQTSEEQTEPLTDISDSDLTVEENNTELSIPADDNTDDGDSDSNTDDGTASDELEIEEDEAVDQTDMNLLVAFGLDNDKGKKSNKAKQLGDRLEAKQTTHPAKKFELDRPEFVDKTQTPKIRREYKKQTRWLWSKLTVAVVFTVLLMIFENVESLTKLFTGASRQFGGALDPAVYPVVYIMISLQLMLIVCLCAIDQIADGFKLLFRGIPKPESLLSVLTVMAILYSIIIARVNDPNREPVMFNFMVALIAVFTLIYSIVNCKRERLNFSIVANKKPKHIVRRIPDEESEGEAKAFRDTDDACDVMKIEKTDFIDGFFGRLSKPDPVVSRFMTVILSIDIAAAVLITILAVFKGEDADIAVRTFFESMLAVAPLSMFMTFSYPFYRANVIAKEYDSAIIGETSLGEYSNASIISFDDKNVFPSYSVKVQNIKIYNNARIDRVLYYAASVFAYAGGPLQDVFEIATVEMGHSKNVKIFDTENGFLATQVDGVNIIFGSCEALRSRGLEIPIEAEEDDVDLSDELSIMYMFRENKLVAKTYIKYVMDADIDLILKHFSGCGLYVCVRTFDPNIDEKMIARKLYMKKIPLKIVRYASAEEVTHYEEKVDSGLVTCGSPKSLLQIISYCEKVLRTRKTNIALMILSVMIGTAILALLVFSNSIDAVNSLYLAVYQLLWFIPMTISSRMFIR